MKIMYVVFKAMIGGHILSTFSIAREIKSRGHDVIFAAENGAMVPHITREMPFVETSVPTWIGERFTYLTSRYLPSLFKIHAMLKQQQPEIVHAFDASSYLHFYLPCKLLNIPLLGTLCGGVDPYYNLPKTGKMIVFSEEQKQKLAGMSGWDDSDIEVVRNRMDISGILSNENNPDPAELESHGINPAVPKLIMITSFGGLKIHGIYNLIEAFSIVREKLKLQLVFIGKGGEGRKTAVEMAEAINTRYDDRSVVFMGVTKDAYRFLKDADVVLGVGRSAFEGMTLGKPTLVVGNNGFAGMVCPETIEALAHYNFSGRNQKEMVVPEVLADLILDIIQNKKKYDGICQYSRNYVVEQLDVKKGAERLIGMYEKMRGDENRLGLSDLFSLMRCIAPIYVDNMMYTPKQYLKSVIGRASVAN